MVISRLHSPEVEDVVDARDGGHCAGHDGPGEHADGVDGLVHAHSRGPVLRRDGAYAQRQERRIGEAAARAGDHLQCDEHAQGRHEGRQQ